MGTHTHCPQKATPLGGASSRSRDNHMWQHIVLQMDIQMPLHIVLIGKCDNHMWQQNELQVYRQAALARTAQQSGLPGRRTPRGQRRTQEKPSIHQGPCTPPPSHE